MRRIRIPALRLRRLRLLPVAFGVMALLAAAKIERMVRAGEPMLPVITAARAADPAPATPATPPAAPAAEPSAEQAAERAVLESLRARRAAIETREAQAVARETMVAAAERRLAQRVEELVALQRRLEALEADRAAREEAGLRGLVKLYEGMRPRDAAMIFNELEMPVLVQIMDQMREAKAAPVMGAMLPERARSLTAELARLRAARISAR
ncbi:MotE family protein [Falsiroseomonas sp. E2-1-a4]|uniref:MotE family protein n=1 Tax=Falsiroseomonas sp. E2-1-a4 TaxID=3239299 RepID=UPI003F3321A9